MGQIPVKAKRRKFLIISLVTNLGLLFSFKYFNFFNDSFTAVFQNFNIFFEISTFDVLLPVGISFYTFQTLSYSIDVYRGTKTPEKHLGIVALYVAFFPQLVAGPIERSTRLLPQLYRKNEFDYGRVTDGLKLVLWGMFQKVVIADRLALIVDQVYNNPSAFGGKVHTIATVLFAFQIFFDFSGYSDIAIGSAKVLGYDLMKNFRRPYFAKSLPEFWRRWHISLSSWFKDYLYIPLGGNRTSIKKWCLNIAIVFILSGLWHGANITFIVWGLLHGFYYAFSVQTRNIREKIASLSGITKLPRVHSLLKGIITFTLVCFAWIFFRANSMADATYIVTHLCSGWDQPLNFSQTASRLNINTLYMKSSEFTLSVVLILLVVIFHYVQEHKNVWRIFSQRPLWLRWTVYAALCLTIMNIGIAKEIPFIYFQF